MRRPRLPIVTLEGLIYLTMVGFVLAGALVRHINLLLALFALMAGLPILSWRLVWAMLRRLRVQRRLPKTVAAGDLLMVQIEAANHRRRLPTWAVTVHDQIRRHGATPLERPIAAKTLFTYVPPASTSKQSYRGRLMRRGRYEFGPLRIATRFPFGLISASLVVEQPQTLLVTPRLGRLTRRWHRLQQSSDLGTSNVERRQGLLEGDFYGLREWRRGDSRRWIHWRTSARRQAPMVRQFERQRNQDLAVVIELWQPSRPEEADEQSVELAVSFAASIVSDLCRRGGRTLWVATAAQSPRFDSGPASLALTREVMESLSVAEATSDDPLPDVLSSTLDVVRPGTNAIVISTRSVNWADTERFRKLWSSPRQRAWIGRLQCIDVTRPDLAEYFVPV
ncbi:MAG: DUF58 domain-containing protein [Planctomycetia bacterium]|nr:DUF58 domain-containing protein [Planctomycetia bacterium]